MNLDQYPRSKRFIEDSGFLNESKLREVQDEFVQSKDVLPHEKGKLTRARNAQDSKSFYSEMEQLKIRGSQAQNASYELWSSTCSECFIFLQDSIKK